MTQEALADAVGVTAKTIHSLESGKTTNPNLRLLMNCAIALNVDLDALIDPMWRKWMVFDESRPGPPDPERFLKPGTMKLPQWVEDLY